VGARLFSNLKDAQLESPRTINGIGRLQDKRLFCSDRIFSPLSKSSASFESSKSEADQHTSCSPQRGELTTQYRPRIACPGYVREITFGFTLRSCLVWTVGAAGLSGASNSEDNNREVYVAENVQCG
jgi:hypothetical protein